MINLSILTTLVSTAPLPGDLPSYHAECRAGIMSSAHIVRMKVAVRMDGDATTVEIDDRLLNATVKTEPIALTRSIGGSGFVDRLAFSDAKGETSVWIAVRGKVEDDLLDFGVLYHKPIGGVSKSTGYTGSCHLVGYETIRHKGVLQ
ncbi:MAG: hypothetical protein R3E04_13005 [Sphingobium sp.]